MCLFLYSDITRAWKGKWLHNRPSDRTQEGTVAALDLCFNFLESASRGGEKVFVFDEDGISWSAAVLMYFLMRCEGRSVKVICYIQFSSNLCVHSSTSFLFFFWSGRLV